MLANRIKTFNSYFRKRENWQRDLEAASVKKRSQNASRTVKMIKLLFSYKDKAVFSSFIPQSVQVNVMFMTCFSFLPDV